MIRQLSQTCKRCTRRGRHAHARESVLQQGSQNAAGKEKCVRTVDAEHIWIIGFDIWSSISWTRKSITIVMRADITLYQEMKDSAPLEAFGVNITLSCRTAQRPSDCKPRNSFHQLLF